MAPGFPNEMRQKLIGEVKEAEEGADCFLANARETLEAPAAVDPETKMKLYMGVIEYRLFWLVKLDDLFTETRPYRWHRYDPKYSKHPFDHVKRDSALCEEVEQLKYSQQFTDKIVKPAFDFLTEEESKEILLKMESYWINCFHICVAFLEQRKANQEKNRHEWEKQATFRHIAFDGNRAQEWTDKLRYRDAQMFDWNEGADVWKKIKTCLRESTLFSQTPADYKKQVERICSEAEYRQRLSTVSCIAFVTKSVQPSEKEALLKKVQHKSETATSCVKTLEKVAEKRGVASIGDSGLSHTRDLKNLMASSGNLRDTIARLFDAEDKMLKYEPESLKSKLPRYEKLQTYCVTLLQIYRLTYEDYMNCEARNRNDPNLPNHPLRSKQIDQTLQLRIYEASIAPLIEIYTHQYNIRVRRSEVRAWEEQQRRKKFGKGKEPMATVEDMMDPETIPKKLMSFFHIAYGHMLFFANCSRNIKGRDGERRAKCDKNWSEQLEKMLDDRKKVCLKYLRAVKDNESDWVKTYWQRSLVQDWESIRWNYQTALEQVKEGKWNVITAEDVSNYKYMKTDEEPAIPLICGVHKFLFPDNETKKTIEKQYQLEAGTATYQGFVNLNFFPDYTQKVFTDRLDKGNASQKARDTLAKLKAKKASTAANIAGERSG
ncbi:hypothetical protein BJ508DRAFT_303271 [Ascobolus immersus RN42]|uniref:Uncharacterized protein n=1 Tax=Ascobolus immersus RN42 TaxID=1160509 RepID=A0A3N4IL10_ASCIM|nr:hypothetical protein BJ508DRAFT_303271 [Ascobolus immersus RN42]